MDIPATHQLQLGIDGISKQHTADANINGSEVLFHKFDSSVQGFPVHSSSPTGRIDDLDEVNDSDVKKKKLKK